MPPLSSPQSMKVSVAGLSRAGRQHLEQLLLRPDCRVSGVWDSNPQVVESMQTLAAGVECWTDLLSSDAEVVFLAVPVAERVPKALELLAAGKHVVVEHPLSLDLTEAGRLVEAGGASARLVIMATASRWEADVQGARAAVREGVIGDLRSLSLHLWQYFPRPAQPETTVREQVWELARDPIDQLLFITGQVPVSVFARIVPGATTLGTGTARSGLSVMAMFDSRAGQTGEHSGGTVANLQIHPQAFPPVDSGWIITGTRGGYSALTRYSATAEDEVVDDPQPRPRSIGSTLFYDAILGALRQQPNPSPIAESVDVLAVLLAMERSCRTGNVETVSA